MDEKPEDKLIDAGTVVMKMAVEGKGVIPIPVTSVFQELFAIINHLDSRVVNIEKKVKIDPDAGENQIITLN